MAVYEVLGLARSLCEVLHGETDMIPTPSALLKDPNEDVVEMSKATFFDMITLQADLLAMASILAFLRTNYIGQKKLCLSEGKLKGVVSRALACLDALGKQAASAALLLLTDASLQSWTVTPSFASKWIESTQNVTGVLKRLCFSYVVEALENLGQETLMTTPKYEHILSDAKYIKSQVKQTLLDWKDRGSVCDRAGELHKAITSASSCYVVLGLGLKLEEDRDWKDTVVAAMGSFAAAKKAVYVICGASIVQTKVSVEQVTSAQKFLASNKTVLPAALLAELQKIVGPNKRNKRKADCLRGS